MLSILRSRAGARQGDGVTSLLGSAAQLPEQLAALRLEPTYIAGFVSPHVDLDAVARLIRQRFFAAGE